MGLRDALRRAASLVVEVPPDDGMSSQFSSAPVSSPAATRTVAETATAMPGPSLDEVQVPAETASRPPIKPDGTPDFDAIYDKAGVVKVPFGTEEALQVIHSLPSDLPLDVQRKTVGATLSAVGKAMGVTTDSVVADTSRKLAALVSFTDTLTAQTGQYETMMGTKISELKAQIDASEKSVADAKAKLANTVALCEKEGDRLDDVLEFFTLDQGASKHA